MIDILCTIWKSADSDYNTLVGIVEGISDDFILMSYYLERDVQVTKKV